MNDLLYDEQPVMFKSNPVLFIVLILLIPFIVGIIGLVAWWVQAKGINITIDRKKTLLR